MSISSWRYISLAGNIYLQLEIYIYSWRYISLAGDISSWIILAARYYTSSLQCLQNANSQKIVQISISCWKKTYEPNEYQQLDNLSQQKFRTKSCSKKSNFWIKSKCLSLAGDICIPLAGDIYISCWRYLQIDNFCSQINTSSFQLIQHANIQKIVYIFISCLKKTY